MNATIVADGQERLNEALRARRSRRNREAVFDRRLERWCRVRGFWGRVRVRVARRRNGVQAATAAGDRELDYSLFLGRTPTTERLE